MAIGWTCPHCNRPQVLADNQFSYRRIKIDLAFHKYGGLAFGVNARACANEECKEVTLIASFEEGQWSVTSQGARFDSTKTIDSYFLRPTHRSKPQPAYIPEVLRADYFEACKIRDLSPKASATLSRRCLQGMIRDFCKISKSRLIDEIEALKELVNEGKAAPRGVEPESVDAIDYVRKVGNIGAHMEKDINVIVEVDPGEAQALIELVEVLFEEWYVARHAREQRLAKVKQVSAAKDQARQLRGKKDDI